MEYTEDREQIKEWAFLLLAGRDDTPIAATKMEPGTDVNYGVLASKMIEWLGAQPGLAMLTPTASPISPKSAIAGKRRASTPRPKHASKTPQSSSSSARRQLTPLAKVRYPREQRLWRLPDWRPMVDLRQTRNRRKTHGQSLWHVSWRCADHGVRTASGLLTAKKPSSFLTLRRLDQMARGGQIHRPAQVDPHRQHSLTDQSRPAQHPTGALPDPAAPRACKLA